MFKGDRMFKVGDWVRLKDKDFNSVFQIELIDEYGNLFDNTQKYRGEQQYYELWQPKEGEWCWFWDHTDSLIVLQQFKEKIVNESKTVYRTTDIAGFETVFYNCEPFIGELPSFLKENR